MPRFHCFASSIPPWMPCIWHPCPPPSMLPLSLPLSLRGSTDITPPPLHRHGCTTPTTLPPLPPSSRLCCPNSAAQLLQPCLCGQIFAVPPCLQHCCPRCSRDPLLSHRRRHTSSFTRSHWLSYPNCKKPVSPSRLCHPGSVALALLPWLCRPAFRASTL